MSCVIHVHTSLAVIPSLTQGAANILKAVVLNPSQGVDTN